MAWDFETDAEYQAQLDWAGAFVRDEVEPLDLVFRGQQYVPPDDRRRQVINPLKEEVRKHRLWATHLGPELGGEGHGQLKLALLNEILGRSAGAPLIFGCQAPDTGNAEIIAHFGTPGQKERALQVHGALGASNEMPFHQMIMGAAVMGLADGPAEVHKVTVARQVLRDYSPSDDLWPSQHIPRRLAAAREKYAEYLEHEVGNQ
jgi:alkylation response protein AidB-like acyl-CoA dehydrogenase